MSCETKYAVRKLKQIYRDKLEKEYETKRPSDGLWMEFVNFRRAISEAILQKPIIGIESEIFVGKRPEIDIFVHQNGRNMVKDVDGVKLDLKIGDRSRKGYPETRIGIYGTWSLNYTTGFVRIIATDKTQTEAFWLKSYDGTYDLKQVVDLDAKVYAPDSLELSQNGTHVIVPGTGKRILKHIMDLDRQIQETFC